jgi:glycolate dehydrogenase FAD-linked subunit
VDNIAQYAGRFAVAIGADNVLSLPDERAIYDHDNKVTGIAPSLVLRPGSTQDVQSVMKICCEKRLPIVPRGAGTGNVGGAVCVSPAVVLDLTRMNRIISLDTISMTVRVEAGLLTERLQNYVEEVGLFYPPDPASADECTIGGNAATNAGGLRAVKYGVSGDYVLGLQVVLADGRLLSTGTATRKGVVGYDLTSLFVGSEGTLGVICELTLRLTRKPERRRTMIASFGDLRHCAKGIEVVLQSPVLPAALELVDEQSVAAAKQTGSAPTGYDAPFLLIELDGRKEVVDSEVAMLDLLLTATGAKTRVAVDDRQTKDIWDARRAISTALKEVAPKKLAEDIAVPISKLADAIGGITKLASSMGLRHAVYGHAGDGNLHVNVLYDPACEGVSSKVEEFRSRLFDLTLELNGTISGEHGIGIAKRAFIARELSAVSLEMHKLLKKQFDHRGILNPGKIWPG